jgi:hypothetical protein
MTVRRGSLGVDEEAAKQQEGVRKAMVDWKETRSRCQNGRAGL